MMNIIQRFLVLLVALSSVLVMGAVSNTHAATTLEAGQYVIFYHNDLLGSPAVVTDHNGNTLWHEHSDPYGRARDRVSETGEEFQHDRVESRKGYTGHLKDDGTNLVYMKARFYDPQIGRFYSNDPIGFSAGNPMMFNRYAYANNNPYRYVDPDGRDAINVRFIEYSVNTGMGFRAPLGHGGVVLVDETSGHTEYYEYGRYSPNAEGIVGEGLPANKGNIRRTLIPNVQIGEDGSPTHESLKNLYSFLKENIGKGSRIEADYRDDADFKKMKDYVESVANDPNRESYNLFNCNCFGFSNDVIQSGRSGDGGFFGTIRNFFSSDGEDE